MANLGALTTTYTPSGAGCQSIHIGRTTGITWIQQGTISDCFPSNFQSQDGYYYSPGICMQSYSYACEVNVGGSLSSITAATCCPRSGFVCHTGRTTGDPNACLSTLTSDSSYVVDVLTYQNGSPTKIGTTAILHQSGDLVFAKGLVAWRASSDIEWFSSAPMSSATTVATLTSPASTPVATASVPIATSADNIILSTSSTPTVSPSSDVQNTNDLSVGAKVGIGLGVSFGSFLLFGVIVAAYLAGKRKGSAKYDDSALIRNAADRPQASKMPGYELDEQRRTLEMSAQREPAELMSSYP
ncbi:hypothetical protein F5Y06DRAFT_45327 [Hypoxylon sp. FL0890]|nr:hypothetical protein F5Y06DRAFT_45327 [Hypoxylon sp. FL0890]